MNWATAQDSHGTTLRPGSRWHLASLSSPRAPGERRWSQALQGPGSVASFDFLEAACREPELQAARVASAPGPPGRQPRTAHSHLPSLGLCQGPLLPGSQDRPEQERSGGTLWATGRRNNNVKPGHPGLGPKMGQGWRGSSRTLGWAESGRRKKAQSLHAAFS